MDGSTKTNYIIGKLLEVGKLTTITIDMITKGLATENYELLEMFLNRVEFSKSILGELCKRSSNSVDRLIGLILDHKVELEEEMLINLIRNNKEELASCFIQMGCPVGSSSLNVACLEKSKKIVSQILQCHIEPTKEAFNSLFYSTGHYQFGAYAPNANEVAEIIDLLVEAGYQPDYNDVVTALKCHCYINRIERFNIEFTSDFILECTKEAFYPYPDINAKPTIECLRIECGRINNMKNIKKLVKLGLKPDIECLRNACNSNSNVPAVRYLLEEHKIKPDIECIKKIEGHVRCPNLTIILKHWVTSEVESPIPIPSKTEATNVPIEEPKPEEIKEEPIVVTEPPTANNKTSELAKLAAELKLDDEFKCFDIDTNDTIIKQAETSITELKVINLTVPEKTPSNHKTKTKIKPTIRKLLKIKDTTVSFLELRKHMTSYITTNGLYDKDTSLIRLDLSMCKALKINQGYLKFDELDTLVSQVYR